MYSNYDVPGKFNSSISLNLTVQSNCDLNCSNSVLLLAVSSYRTLKHMEEQSSSHTLGELDVCCWGSECENGTVSNETVVYRQPLGEEEGTVQWTQRITQTDLYDVFIAVCGGSVRFVTLSGSLIMLNPYGYLPGETYPYLHFFFVAVCAYGFLLCLWTALLYWHWSASIPLQKCYIPALLFICAAEECLTYLSWNYLNDQGSTSFPLIISCLVVNSMRNTLARVLMLAVSMGYGITIPQLRRKAWMITLAVVYFLANLVYIAAGIAQHFNQIESRYLMLVTLPISLLSTVFYFWTFIALTSTMHKLKVEQQSYKLAIFTRLTLIFAVAIQCTVLVFAVECYYRFAQEKTDYWEIVWRFEAAWHVVFFVTIAGVILLWRPTARSKSLAFTLELVEARDISASDLSKPQGIQLHHIGYEGESN